MPRPKIPIQVCDNGWWAASAIKKIIMAAQLCHAQRKDAYLRELCPGREVVDDINFTQLIFLLF